MIGDLRLTIDECGFGERSIEVSAHGTRPRTATNRQSSIVNRQCLLLSGLATILASPALAQPVDKSQYHLFNPTPRELMRPLSADRPDITESPHTVDAGHVQLELSFFEYLRDGDLRAYSVMPTNIKIGVLNNIDFQFFIQPYVHQRDADPNTPGRFTTDSGFGDIQLRSKINLWGNDEGATAMAIMPFVTLPTASGELGAGRVEGGLILPFGMSIGEDVDLGLMAEFGAIYDRDRDAYDFQFLHTAALGRDLIGPLGGYVEYVGIASTAPGARYQVLLGLGLTYALSADWVLDAGVNLGLAGGAPDFNPFIGMTVRF
jgi:hypothetical protein